MSEKTKALGVSVMALAALAAVVVFVSSPVSPRTAAAQDDADPVWRLCRAYLAAHEKADFEAFNELIFRNQPATAAELTALRGVFEADCRQAVASIAVRPLEPDDVTEYVHEGAMYVPSLPPVGKLVVQFATDDRARVQSASTTFLVGEHAGRYVLLTAVPQR